MRGYFFSEDCHIYSENLQDGLCNEYSNRGCVP